MALARGYTMARHRLALVILDFHMESMCCVQISLSIITITITPLNTGTLYLITIPSLEIIKLFFMLNSAEHGSCPANK